QGKLRAAPSPLKLAEVAKGLPKPKKVSAAEMQDQVRAILNEEVRVGRAFCCPSGKGGVMRHWSRDEKQLLRDKAVDLAATPKSMWALKKDLGKEVKGTDGSFVEELLRELIGEDRLFEHPAKTKAGGSLLGPSPPPPPPPPLEQPKHHKTLTKI